MRILVNYDKREQPYLTVLQYFLKQQGFSCIVSSSTLSSHELVGKALATGCEGIFLCNTDTLTNCVPDGSKLGLDEWRGSYLRLKLPCVVGNSLAHTQTVPYGTWLLQKDLGKLKEIISLTSHGSEMQKAKAFPAFSFAVLEEVDMFPAALEELGAADIISYDIETKTIGEDEAALKAGSTYITCCSWTAVYSDRSTKTFVLPLVDFTEAHWKTKAEFEQAIQFLRTVNAFQIPKVMHNGMYDCLHSIVYRAYPMNWTLDTMAMMHAEFSELPKTLDFVASLYLLDYCQWKAEAAAASKAHDIRKYWAYNAKDTWTTARLCLHYLDKLPAYARKNYQIQFPLVYPSLYCNMEGFKIDQKKRLEIREQEERKLEESLHILRTNLADKNFNPSSPKQVKFYIYDVLGAKDPRIGTKKTAEGKKVRNEKGTSEKNLLAVGAQHPLLSRITTAIISYREAKKAISTYMDFLQLNGRLYYSLNPFGTESGRMSCTSSSFWCGTQVQNIPKYAKSMLIADDGFELMEIDNSQSEARCTAYLAQDLALKEALETPGKDFYTSLGTLFFGIPYEKVTKEFRNKVLKKIVHGTNYMMGASTFIENVGVENLVSAANELGIKLTFADKHKKEGELTLKEFAAHLLESYHKPFFRIREWYQEIKNEIKATKMLKSPLGHTRYFFGNVEKNHRAFNSAVAHAPQNLSVSILNIGFWRVWLLVKKYKGNLRLKAQIHDSVLVQYKKEYAEEIQKELLRALDNPVTIHGRVLRIPIEAKVGDSWGTMTELPAKE